MTRTKVIDQHKLSGVYVETQFKNQRDADLMSDYVNIGIFNDWESFEILREANFIGLNSIPIDFISLMDLP